MPMTLDEFLGEFHRQPMWTRDGKRAPHKALALLFAMGRLRAGERLCRYSDGAPRVAALLEQFGPPRVAQHPGDPIWRLRPRSGAGRAIWEVRLADSTELPAVDNPPLALLSREGAFGLSEDVALLFAADPGALELAAVEIADAIVPETLRDELLSATIGATAAAPQAVDLQAMRLQSHVRVLVYRTRRDPSFPRRVLEAYGHRCAVCEASPRLGGEHFGLEAAHIRWLQADGPNAVANGLCLCRMHHVALDRGAITLTDDLRIRISPLVDRSLQSDRLFWQFEAQRLRVPERQEHAPLVEHCAWRRGEVFRVGGVSESAERVLRGGQRAAGSFRMAAR